jgi:hypothetical protein
MPDRYITDLGYEPRIFTLDGEHEVLFPNREGQPARLGRYGVWEWVQRRYDVKLPPYKLGQYPSARNEAHE